MTRVVLSALEPGVYVVRRRPSEHFEPPGPLVREMHGGWWSLELNGVCVERFPYLAHARRWLNGSWGQSWLDGVPRLGREDRT